MPLDDIWRRQTENPITYVRDDGQPAKGVAPPIVHVSYEILQRNPLIVRYIEPALVEQYDDSHGQLDHLKTYAPPYPDGTPRDGVYRGRVVSFISDVRCTGRSLEWTLEKWLLIPGTEGGCDSFEVITTPPLDWFRQTVNPLTYRSPTGDPAKGVSYDAIVLSFYEDEEGIHTTLPRCNPFEPETAAKAATFYVDSHGQLDKIESIPQHGPNATVVSNVNVQLVPCDEPLFGYKWRVVVNYQDVTLHPGSQRLAQENHSIQCCYCCLVCIPPCPDNCVNMCCCQGIVHNNPCQCVPKTLAIEIVVFKQGDLDCVPCVPCGQGEGVLNWNEGLNLWSGTLTLCDCDVTVTVKCNAITENCMEFASDCFTCTEGGGWEIDITSECTGDCFFVFLDQDNISVDCCCPLHLSLSKSLTEECCGGPEICPDGCCAMNLTITEGDDKCSA